MERWVDGAVGVLPKVKAPGVPLLTFSEGAPGVGLVTIGEPGTGKGAAKVIGWGIGLRVVIDKASPCTMLTSSTPAAAVNNSSPRRGRTPRTPNRGQPLPRMRQSRRWR